MLFTFSKKISCLSFIFLFSIFYFSVPTLISYAQSASSVTTDPSLTPEQQKAQWQTELDQTNADIAKWQAILDSSQKDTASLQQQATVLNAKI